MNPGAEPAAPWDPGLQNERTALAWNRTTLSLVSAGLVVARIGYPSMPVVATVLAVLSVVIAASAQILTTRRYTTANRRLTGNGPLPDGRLPAVVSTLTTITGLLALAAVLTTV